MVRLDVSTFDIAYLLGGVGMALRAEQLTPIDRAALETLRDRLAIHLNLDDDVAEALRVFLPDRLQ